MLASSKLLAFVVYDAIPFLAILLHLSVNLMYRKRILQIGSVASEVVLSRQIGLEGFKESSAEITCVFAIGFTESNIG